ncbi:MAG TPA: type II toxin-antitoxin system VapC family toxin [Candidatus Saccharimonadales bacterium]|jgi:ribonuclease VapC|nr:type II toxin-antitoxin system VapC family toxin [Candidatus Saccharimonadales bacterium]
MVIDSSALIAILLNEIERERFLDLILAADRRLVSAGTALEAGIVLEYRSSPIATREFDLFLHQAGIEIVAFDANQADRGRIAYRKYGKGRHPAALNFGDCFTHALATVSGEPVLAKGEAFARAGLNVCR